jgi:hypothetical protein
MHEKRTLSVQRFENTLTRNDFFVDLTIYNIPVSLLEDFSECVIKPVYAGQVTEAIKDLMRSHSKTKTSHKQVVSLTFLSEFDGETSNWKATMEYAKTKDIIHVMQILGHKNIQNTMLYTQLFNFESDEYHSAIAKETTDAQKLIEAGFEYVCSHENFMLFRKRK